jgi:hypothetical protein
MPSSWRKAFGLTARVCAKQYWSGSHSFFRTPYDLIRATFPAGTVSGAPKIRAMQIIAAAVALQISNVSGTRESADALIGL